MSASGEATSTLNAAISYNKRGWQILDAVYKSKKPIQEDWTHLDYTEEQLQRIFGNGHKLNIGLRLGDVSRKVVDIDLDSPEIQRLKKFLPETDAIFGHPSKPESHYLYYLSDDKCPPTKRYIYRDTCIGEYRANGAQTILPPSIHTSGELIIWYRDGEPSVIEYRMLDRRMGILCSAALVAKFWGNGIRHQATGALAGGLSRSGWQLKEILFFISLVCIAAEDEEKEDRLRFAEDTLENHTDGEPTTGWQTLATIIPEDAVSTIRKWLNLAEKIATYNHTDTGNAERLIRDFGNDIRYSELLRKWFIWNGAYWQPDETTRIYEHALNSVRRIPQEAKHLDYEKQKKFHQFSIRSEDQKRLTAMVDIAAKTQVTIKVHPNELDTQPFLFNVLNGTIDLRDSTFHEHNRTDNITKIAPVIYTPGADCSLFLHFVDTIFAHNQELIQYIQTAIGYSMTGIVLEKALFVCVGETDTGKSTFLADVLQKLFGVYATQVREETVAMTRNNASNETDLAQLKGIRFALVSEPRDTMRLHEARVKAMTGRNKLVGRFLYSNPFEFDVTHKLWLDTNYAPAMSNRDDAIWNRAKFIPFNVQIPRISQDLHLADKLQKEFPGILNWCIQGAGNWYINGLHEPQTVIDSTSTIREEMDTIGQYLKERYEFNISYYISRAELRTDYVMWCEDNAVEPIKSGGARGLWTKELERHGLKKDTKNKVAVWSGAKLKND